VIQLGDTSRSPVGPRPSGGDRRNQPQAEERSGSSEQASKSTEKLEGRFSKLDSTVGDFNRSFTATGNVVKLVKFPALIAGAGLATQAIGALAAGAVSLGSALAPLSGLAAAGAAGYAAMAQATGVVKLATMGLTKALGGNKDALKALPPAGKDLVALLKDLKPRLKDLQQTAAAGLLPGLAEGAKNALPVLRPLKGIVSDTAHALGDLAAQAGKLVGSKSVLADLSTIGKTNITVIRNVGTAALSLAHALLGVVAAGGPLLTWLTQGGVKLAAWIDAQVTAGRESGKLAGFLNQTKAVLKTLGPIFVNLAAGLYNIGKAAAPLGRDLLGQFEKLTEKFRQWTESATGRNQIAAYFQNARGPILQIVGLIGDIGGALLRISQGKGASALVAQFRTLVPVLENVVTSTTAAFGPALIDALGNVLRLFGLLAGSSGPLVQLVADRPDRRRPHRAAHVGSGPEQYDRHVHRPLRLGEGALGRVRSADRRPEASRGRTNRPGAAAGIATGRDAQRTDRPGCHCGSYVRGGGCDAP
jgi:hypothetical protein